MLIIYSMFLQLFWFANINYLQPTFIYIKYTVDVRYDWLRAMIHDLSTVGLLFRLTTFYPFVSPIRDMLLLIENE